MAQNAKKLTTTSYILLGQLMAKPWSAYDLTKHLQRSLTREIWPRAESHIYDEVKNLAAHGLATVAKERTGGRTRAVYTITEAGRRAFRQWLAEPADNLLFEWEKIVKIAFGDYLSKDQLLDQLAMVRGEILDKTDYWDTVIGAAKSPDDMVFPHRAHIGGVIGELLTRIHDAICDWSDWAEAEIADWPTAEMSSRAEASYLRILQRNQAKGAARLAKHGRANNAVK